MYVVLCLNMCRFDMENESPQAINYTTIDHFTYLKKLVYEKIPFEGKSCHEYDNFTKYCHLVTPPHSP